MFADGVINSGSAVSTARKGAARAVAPSCQEVACRLLAC